MLLLIDLSFFYFFIFLFIGLNLIFLTIAFNHFIIALIFLDILLLVNIIIFVVHSILSFNPVGYGFALVILGVAAADTAVGLGLFIIFFKATANVSIREIRKLRWRNW